MAVTVLRGVVPSSGSGYGYGDGSGDGYGDGDGSGYGYGDGSGSGYGYGDGDGDGSGEYWRACLRGFLTHLLPSQRIRAEALEAAGATLAFWRSDTEGRAANGGGGPIATVGLVQREPGPLRDECGVGQLHATLVPPKWRGDRWWIVALIGEVRGGDEKYWALEREIIGEAL